MDELTAWLALARTPGLHAGSLRPALDRFKAAAAILSADPAQLRALGFTPKQAAWLRAPDCARLDADVRWLDQPQRQFISCRDAAYPRALAQLSDAPLGLFVRGDVTALASAQIAIVGSRNPTPAGRDNALRLAAELAQCGIVVTSGLANGIDTAAHRGALRAGGRTVAVCGTGLDIPYPRANTELTEEIAAQGTLVSEFPLGTPAVRTNFPRRNRIISGLALGTIVVEAALRSGSLITARLAADQGREVFAVPGSVRNPLAQGCHALIRQGAHLVEGVADVLAELPTLASARAVAATHEHADAVGHSGPRLDKGYEILLDALGFEPAGVDCLVARSGLRADEVASMLLILELEGRIESYPGGLYVRRA